MQSSYKVYITSLNQSTLKKFKFKHALIFVMVALPQTLAHVYLILSSLMQIVRSLRGTVGQPTEQPITEITIKVRKSMNVI